MLIEKPEIPECFAKHHDAYKKIEYFLQTHIIDCGFF